MPWNTKVLNQNLNLFPETPRFVAIQKWCLPESYVKSYVKSYILLPPIFFKSPPKKNKTKKLAAHHLQPPTLYTWNSQLPPAWLHLRHVICLCHRQDVFVRHQVIVAVGQHALLKGCLGLEICWKKTAPCWHTEVGWSFQSPSFLRSPKGWNLGSGLLSQDLKVDPEKVCNLEGKIWGT